MIRISVNSNRDDAFVAWAPTDFIAGCRGFMLERQRQVNGGEPIEIVENRVGFAKDRPKFTRPSAIYDHRTVLPKGTMVPPPASRSSVDQTPRWLPQASTWSCGSTVAANQRSRATLSTSQRNRASRSARSTSPRPASSPGVGLPTERYNGRDG
jgi:hypothetical protein